MGEIINNNNNIHNTEIRRFIISLKLKEPIELICHIFAEFGFHNLVLLHENFTLNFLNILRAKGISPYSRHKIKKALVH